MIKPAFLERTDQPTVIGQVFGSSLVVKGWTGFPLLPLAGWAVLTWVAGSKHPQWSASKKITAGATTASVAFGSEWLHDLAHAATASLVGKPADAVRVFYGTPLLIYYDINDRSVSPAQHLLRATGGPLINAVVVPFTWLAKRLTREGSVSRYIADFALGTNIFLATVSLLPIPEIDGGALLKWSLVRNGRSIFEADETVKKVNTVVGSALAGASALAVKKKRPWLAGMAGALAIISLVIGAGLFKEQK